MEFFTNPLPGRSCSSQSQNSNNQRHRRELEMRCTSAVRSSLSQEMEIDFRGLRRVRVGVVQLKLLWGNESTSVEWPSWRMMKRERLRGQIRISSGVIWGFIGGELELFFVYLILKHLFFSVTRNKRVWIFWHQSSRRTTSRAWFSGDSGDVSAMNEESVRNCTILLRWRFVKSEWGIEKVWFLFYKRRW